MVSSLDSCLQRIAARDDKVHAWAFFDADAARAEPVRTGPLAGVVVGVKDVIDVAGMPTTHGSPAFAKNIAIQDARCVAKLRTAGAIILGKTVTTEFATYFPGPTTNPINPAHTPGGSSSGSAAAVADGQADLTFGTQTAGSVLRPASFCGILGFKPSFGRYPLHGVLETAPSLDTLGLFARSLPILVAADAVLADQPALPAPNRAPIIGLCRSPAWDEADASMQAAFLGFADRLRASGLTLVERALPPVCEGLSAAQTLIHRHEASVVLAHVRQRHADVISKAFRDMVDQGAADSPANYQAALACQQAGRAALPEIFSGIDLLLVPGARLLRDCRRPATRPSSASGQRWARPALAFRWPGRPMGCRWVFS
jgi:Asp-tRNA(Asn)/Glu-tRNA(Gln) amidotransferase A subunit family amidase